MHREMLIKETIVQDVEVALKLLGKNIAVLKSKTTRKKPKIVARDQVNIPAGLIKLHKEVFLTGNTFL